MDRATRLYHPQPQRAGIGLCLSGGGFRATLFHLGALRRLNELGILPQVTTITSVSGGSIMAAHLATVLPRPLTGPVADWEERVARPIRAFTAADLRTGALLKRFWPWNWFNESTGVEALATRYQARLTPLRLHELPERPNYILCATDMAFGDGWIFERRRMGAYLPGYIAPPPTEWPLARAVAASSCFPPIFNPLPVTCAPAQYRDGRAPAGTERDAALSDLRLTDGGNYDNLGLEPVWRDHQIVLVSDGGALFDFEGDKNLIWRIARYVGIIENQATSLRKRWLISSFLDQIMQGTYWGIGGARSSYDADDEQGYPKALARGLIAQIRTDLDAFSEAEASVLENHGYLLADKAIGKHLPTLLPTPVPPLNIPHPEWMDLQRVSHALKNSGRVKLFGRNQGTSA